MFTSKVVIILCVTLTATTAASAENSRSTEEVDLSTNDSFSTTEISMTLKPIVNLDETLESTVSTDQPPSTIESSTILDETLESTVSTDQTSPTPIESSTTRTPPTIEASTNTAPTTIKSSTNSTSSSSTPQPPTTVRSTPKSSTSASNDQTLLAELKRLLSKVTAAASKPLNDLIQIVEDLAKVLEIPDDQDQLQFIEQIVFNLEPIVEHLPGSGSNSHEHKRRRHGMSRNRQHDAENDQLKTEIAEYVAEVLNIPADNLQSSVQQLSGFLKDLAAQSKKAVKKLFKAARNNASNTGEELPFDKVIEFTEALFVLTKQLEIIGGYLGQQRRF